MKVVLMKLKVVVEVVVEEEEEEEVGVVNPVAPEKKVLPFWSLLVRLVLVLKLLKLMPVLNLHLQQTTSTICPPLFKALNHSFLLPSSSSPSPLLTFYLSLPVELSQSRKVSKLLRTYRRRGALREEAKAFTTGVLRTGVVAVVEPSSNR